IVRFNLDRMLTSNFPKEAYLVRKLAGTALPLAPILHLGRLGDLQFAISRKLPGKMLQEHTPQEVKALLPQILDLMEVAHSVDTSETQGYGVFDDRGNGLDTSWHASLLKVAEEEDERDYFGKWHRMFDETFLERNLFEDLYQRMKELLAYCPEERTLILGGFTTRNMLAQDGKITAVLDLLSAGYGDVVDDIVALDFWWPPLGIREAFLEYQQQRGRDLPFYTQRLLCYECYHALIGLRFFAKSDNEQGYQMVREIIQQKLETYGG
ncbi:MAG TPA: phosphotransferase, partial [Ktedonobacteraceae bacterium]|nr:phosphotransferase [Ktedonobacteraceae bacterium]